MHYCHFLQAPCGLEPTLRCVPQMFRITSSQLSVCQEARRQGAPCVKGSRLCRWAWERENGNSPSLCTDRRRKWVCCCALQGSREAGKCGQISRLLGCELLWKRGSWVSSRERLVCSPPGDRTLTFGSSLPPQQRQNCERRKAREEERGTAPLNREKRECGGGLIGWVYFLQGTGVLLQSGLGLGVPASLLVQRRPPQLSITDTPCAHF